jgi:hypothetical protein
MKVSRIMTLRVKAEVLDTGHQYCSSGCPHFIPAPPVYRCRQFGSELNLDPKRPGFCLRCQACLAFFTTTEDIAVCPA